MIETHKYSSLRDFCVRRRIMLPKPTEEWRLLKGQPVGNIHALPGLRGRAVATNGIIVAIELEDESVVFGHLEWFKRDREEAERERRQEKDMSMFNTLMADFA